MNKPNYFSLLYRNYFKPDISYKDIFYDKDLDVLYISMYNENYESTIAKLDKNSLDIIDEFKIDNNIHVIKLFNSNEMIFYLGRVINNGVIDNFGPIVIGYIDKNLNDNIELYRSDNNINNLQYSDNKNSIFLAYDNMIYKFDKDINETSIHSILNETSPGDIVNLNSVNNSVYYSYRIRKQEIDEESPGRYLNLNAYYVNEILSNGNIIRVTRLISYSNEIDDSKPISINHDGVNLIITTSDGLVRLYRTKEYYKKNSIKIYNTIPTDYPFEYILYDKFIPIDDGNEYNIPCTCTSIYDNLMYIGNDVGDVIVYIDNLYNQPEVTKEELLANKFRINKIIEYNKLLVMDNIANSAISDIITYDYNIIANFDGNGLVLYKRDVKPYIDGDIICNSFIRDTNLNINLKFKVNHDEKMCKINYKISVYSESNKIDIIDPIIAENLEPGIEFESVISIPCRNIEKYDIKLIIEITDNINNKLDPVIFDIQTLFVSDPIIFENQISVCYRTASSSDLFLEYEIIKSHNAYKKTSILDPNNKIYIPDEWDSYTREIIESQGIFEGDYFCIVEEWEFDNPIKREILPVISTNGIDWKISINSKGELVSEPYEGVSFNYINIPIEKEYPSKFIYKYRFYTDYNFNISYPDDIEYYIYDNTNTIENNFRSRETGDINNKFDFHLLDIIINCTRMVPIGRSMLLKRKVKDINSEILYDINVNELWDSNMKIIYVKSENTYDIDAYEVYRVIIDENGNVSTIRIMNYEDIGVDINSINEYEVLTFRENSYSSSVTLTVNTSNGIKYWDFTINSEGTFNAELLDTENDKYGDLAFVARYNFDYEYVASLLRRLSNPISILVSNINHDKYRVKDSVDKAGTKTSTSYSKQMEMLINPTNLSDEELFTANYHYFDVYIDGKKLRKEQVKTIKSEHGDYSVRFPYQYDFSRQTYILECIKYNINYDNDILYDINENELWDSDRKVIHVKRDKNPNDRFIPMKEPVYYEMSIQQDDRIILKRVIEFDKEPYKTLPFYNGWIFLTLDDYNDPSTVRCNSLHVTTKYDKRANREFPKYYEISSEYENETRRLDLINDIKEVTNYNEILYDVNKNEIQDIEENTIYVKSLTPILSSNEFEDRYRMHTYDSIKNDHFYSVEAVLNSTANYSTEEIVAKRIVTSEEEVQELYAGKFAMTINCNGSNLNNSDFFVFVRFLHASYYTRIDRGYFEIYRNSSNNNIVYVKLDNTVLASINSEIILTTVDVERTITLNTDKDSNDPYYYVPLVKYDKVGNMQTFYVTDVSKFDVFINGFALIPGKDYSLVNCSLHSHMPSMIVFGQGVEPGSKIEINFLDDDVYSTLIIDNKSNSDIIEIKDNTNLFVSNTFIIYVNNRKLDNTQYSIIDRKHLKILIANRRNVVIKFQYKNYDNMRQIIDLLHSSDKFMNQEEISDNEKITQFSSDVYHGIDDSKGYGKAYQILGFADESFKLEEDVIYDCNKDNVNIIDTPINTGIMYNLDYFNNNLIIDCNNGYDRDDYTLLSPLSESLDFVDTVEYYPPKFSDNFRITNTSSGQRILEIEISDSDSEYFSKLIAYINGIGKDLVRDGRYSYKISDGCYRICGNKLYHDRTNINGTISYLIVDDDGNESKSIEITI